MSEKGKRHKGREERRQERGNDGGKKEAQKEEGNDGVSE